MKAESKPLLDPQTQRNVDAWVNGNFDSKTQDEIRQLLKNDPQQLSDAFYTTLSFGTGGLRGLIGVGCNRINQYTVRFATQGLANYIKKHAPDKPSVVIGYDSRHRSQEFAEEASRVLAGNGIEVHLFSELRSTPLVSFACRHLNATAAIVITASHNPPEYNGYKAYWSDGAQVIPPHDQGIIDEVNKIESPGDVSLVDLPHNLVHLINHEIDQAYLDATEKLQHYPMENKKSGKELKIVYTSLHGTGITIVPSILERWGFASVSLVEEQSKPDGRFPTVKAPNPEDHDAMAMGVEQMKHEQADLLIGTDPDNDRVGAVVMHEGEPIYLNGNQIACLCLHHICEAHAKHQSMPKKAAFVKTIVTSELFRAIAEDHNCPCFDVLTGFKYIAELIREWEEGKKGAYQYVFGGEESYGYLLGTHARDKDGAISCALICEAALAAKLRGRTLLDELHRIYEKYGVYRESLINIKFPETKDGREKMRVTMEKLRADPPKVIGGKAVSVFEDYLTSNRRDLGSGEVKDIDLPNSNVLIFHLEDQSKIAVRPSGTEPKVKVYFGLREDVAVGDVEGAIERCQVKVERLEKEMGSILG
ncbi:Phosphoglucomutase [Chlamydiales bacterium SCGC AG-110-M15]|nr:Phosphoglucomutase [Chlamydiales bacterium SCGC AG-110-M15]